MTDDELGHILGAEDEILPSSGFVASVMEAVRTEALTPTSIPFPWKHALPGLTAAVVVLAWLFVETVWQQIGSGMKASLSVAPLPSTLTVLVEASAWSAMALLLSLVLLMLSMQLASRRT